MMEEEKEYIQVEFEDGDVEQLEIIADVMSQRDNKHYVLLSNGQTSEEDVDIVIGALNKTEDGEVYMDYVNDKNEIDYVMALVNKKIEGESNE